MSEEKSFDQLIDESIKSGKGFSNAEEAYNKLTDKQKKEIKNYKEFNDKTANQVENKLIEWEWKYHKTYDTHYRRNTYTYFKVLKEIPDKIKITD